MKLVSKLKDWDSGVTRPKSTDSADRLMYFRLRYSTAKGLEPVNTYQIANRKTLSRSISSVRMQYSAHTATNCNSVQNVAP